MAAPALEFSTDLLAPGDGKSAVLNPADFSWQRIRSVLDPAFEEAYAVLWQEFGACGEMETRAALELRFAQAPGMLYEMLLVKRDGRVAAVRDHTAVWADGEVVVHLSHIWISPEQRRTGLAGWLRAAPLITARECATARGAPTAAVTFLAEMEYDDGADERRTVRLRAYERAGFLKIDPRQLHYHQPDFRSAEEIDAAGGPVPLAFQLVVRRIGREHERVISGAEVRRLVVALYRMYAVSMRAEDFHHPLLNIATLPSGDVALALLPPTTPSC
jgi:GNAT superfamily N-acetyltransferase